MAKIVKIPLVMKNGEKATDMKSMTENFDIESVLGYFLDGKLTKWLNDRYYEDEAEAIRQLNKDDPFLSQKLCEIFGVEYEIFEEIDLEKIGKRNERLARLKQLTDDQETLQNIDAVAFDQEELAELYDQGVEKIYLCEGNFRIPKSKQRLEYILIGDATVTGLPINESNTKAENIQNVRYDSIPEFFADRIKLNPYVNLKDYVFYYDEQIGRQWDRKEDAFWLLNKITGAVTSFHIEGCDCFQKVESDGNKLLFFDSSGKQHLYDVYGKHCEHLCLSSGALISDNKISYISGDRFDSNRCLMIYDIATKKTQVLEKLGVDAGTDVRIIAFCGSKILIDMYPYICLYDIDSGKSKNIFDRSGYMIKQVVPFKDYVYLFLYDVGGNCVALWSIQLNEIDSAPSEHFRFSGENSYGLHEQIQIAPYFIFIQRSYDFPVYAFNMNSNELTQVASGCGYTYHEPGGLFRASSTTHLTNKFQVVGDYLYYLCGNEYNGGKLHRISLSNPKETNKIIE